MDIRLTRNRHVTRQKVRVSITTKKANLKKQHASSPDPGTPPEPRQDVFADERLDLEEQESSGENGQGEGGHGVGVARDAGAGVGGKDAAMANVSS